jgi:Tfp pilus assembly ATPase PilU
MRKDGEGRIPATEILLGTSMIKKLIIAGKLGDVYKTIDQGAYYGMHTFDNDLLELYKNGVITVEEALDKATNSDDMTLSLKGIDRGK